MARYGKGLSTNASIVNLGFDKPKDLVPPGMGKAASATSMVHWLAMDKLGVGKPKQSLIRASAGFEGGMKGLVERAKEHNVGQWGHEAFGDNYYNDLKSDRGIAAYLVSQARDGKYDPRVWQAERADQRSQLESKNIENKEAKAAVEESIPYEAPEDSKEYKQAEDRSNAYRQNLNNLLSSHSQTKFDKSSQKYLNDYKIDLIADHQKRKKQKIEQDLV